MFIKQISDEAYLELAGKYGNIDCYFKEHYGKKAHTLVGYISVEGEIPSNFIPIYEPEYDKYFVAIRVGNDELSRITVASLSGDNGKILSLAKLIHPADLYLLTVSQEAVVELYSQFTIYFNYKIKRPECS